MKIYVKQDLHCATSHHNFNTNSFIRKLHLYHCHRVLAIMITMRTKAVT